MKTSIIIDTDIGDDIDDALAIAVALNSPEIEVRGITTVFRNAERRAVLTRHLLQTFGRELPIVPGCSKPLLQSWSAIKGGAGLENQFEVLSPEAAPEAASMHAAQWLIEQSKQIETLTIVPIGPLTNIALSLSLDPSLARRTTFVLMGGQWSAEMAEWNILCDPEAAAILFNSGAKIKMIGLDVTTRCRLNQEQVARFASRGTAQCELLARLISLWQAAHPHPVTLHDPLTILSLFSDCVQFEPKRIEVELCGANRGKTLIKHGEPNAQVAVDVDVAAAIELFLARALG